MNPMVLLTLSLLTSSEGKRPVTEADVKAGKAVYMRECSACHGESGDGEGHATPFLDPPPRNFQRRLFRVRTTESGEPPATADLLRTVEDGLPGSAMPAFSWLSAEEKRQAVAYVLNIADLLEEPEPAPIADPGEGPPTTPESIALGKASYQKMLCGSCHGDKGKGDGAAAKTLKDERGRPIRARDLTAGVFRGGGARKDLYYRFTTGMDGSPMPGFADSLSDQERWALADYVLSLKTAAPAKPLPADPIKAGREVAAKYGCRGCHYLDDGKGGDAGPDLRLSAQKLGSEWVATFLASPRDQGKIYPWRGARMPRLGITGEEIGVMVGYLAKIAKRKPGPLALPDPSTFPAAKLEEGKLLFVTRCSECHALGKVVDTPLIKQQGPDLIRAATRVDYEWAKRWITDPQKIDPKTKMTNPMLTPDQIDAVRMFVWKSSMDAQAARAANP